MTLLLFGVFLVLLFLGVPVAFSIGISSLAYVLFTDIPLVIIPQKMYTGIDVFVLLCVPGFILAGNHGMAAVLPGVLSVFQCVAWPYSRRARFGQRWGIYDFCRNFRDSYCRYSQHRSRLIPAMKNEGYEADFSCAVTASSSTWARLSPKPADDYCWNPDGLSVSKLFQPEQCRGCC